MDENWWRSNGSEKWINEWQVWGQQNMQTAGQNFNKNLGSIYIKQGKPWKNLVGSKVGDEVKGMRDTSH